MNKNDKLDTRSGAVIEDLAIRFTSYIVYYETRRGHPPILFIRDEPASELNFLDQAGFHQEPELTLRENIPESRLYTEAKM